VLSPERDLEYLKAGALDVIDGEEAFRELRAYSAERRRQHA
jgi:hypothetical protein